MFERVAILNRGAAAVRLIVAAREVARERGAPLRTIALYTEADRDAMFVRDADERYGFDPDHLGAALRAARADAVWVGWGFVTDEAAVADLCTDLGATFIGSGSEVLRRLADAGAARALADAAGLPLGGPAGARRIEVPVVADGSGTVWPLGTRDASLRHLAEPLIDEAPAPGLSPDEERAASSAAVRAARAAGVLGAGTVSLLFDPATRRFGFERLVPGLDGGHPVTETTTGLDLVKLQLEIAAGIRLAEEPPALRGHAVQARLRAEDPERGFAPAPGTIERFRMPVGPGVRVDTGYDRDDTVPAGLDPGLATLVAAGGTRDEALARLRRALADTTLILRGGASNKGFLLEILGHVDVARGATGTGWLDRLIDSGAHLSPRNADVAVVQAAIDTYEEENAAIRLGFLRAAERGRATVAGIPACTAELGHRGQRYSARVSRLDRHLYRVEIDGHSLIVQALPLAPGERRLGFGAESFRVTSTRQGASRLIEVDGAAQRIALGGGELVRAPAPAVVVSVNVAPGDLVAAGDRLVVLEAMKSYIDVRAEHGGRVREVAVVPNVQVGAGRPLLILDGEEAPAPSAAPAPRLDFAPLARAAAPAGLDPIGELRSLVLGYDATPRRLPAGLDPDLGDEVLETFADLVSLFRRLATEPLPDADSLDETRTSPVEYLALYLRDRRAEGTGLPPRFVARLRRALARYGVASLEPTPDLEESLFRIFRARQRLDEAVPAILDLLGRRLERGLPDDPDVRERYRDLLDRLIADSHDQLTSLYDLAREVRYALFERHLVEESRRSLFADVAAHAEALAHGGTEVERQARVRALVAVPHPLHGSFAAQLPGATPALRRAMAEILLVRNYRIRPLEAVRFVQLGGETFAETEYVFDGMRIHVLVAHVEHARLPATLASAIRHVETLPAGRDVCLDFYSAHPGPREEAATLGQKLAELVRSTPCTRPLRRIVFSIVPPSVQPGDQPVQHFTFRPGDDGVLDEERSMRGLHPMVARRLQLGRLSRFTLDRLPSPEEVFLFHAVAHENPSDERLFALAEVRDLTPVRDRDGKIIGLPHLERVLLETLSAMRAEQTRRGAKGRLHWNRVQLFVWPPWIFPIGELDPIIRRLAPATEGLGLERVLVRAQVADGPGGPLRDQVIELMSPTGKGVAIQLREPTNEPMAPLSPYTQKVVRLRQQGLTYPYETLSLLAPRRASVGGLPPGEFVEYDLDAAGELVPVHRPPGENQANIVAGVVTNFTAKHPEGMARVILLGDPSKEMGSLAEAECLRIMAAIALAQRLKLPLEWFALSAGAKIAMDSGSENMDYIALALRRIIEFTQAGGEINVIVDGINVGAQPYWNAEATMLMHTRGILIMTPQGAMVLTGKRALDFSGGVSADDNFGIGGYERIMGPNGQAQYFAEDLPSACRLLLRHYEHTYVAPGERFPRRAETADPVERDVRTHPHARGHGFTLVGDVVSDEKNPGRKKPFDIRSIMSAAIDQDHSPLERWFAHRGAEVAVVWDAHIGGYPVCLLGIESRPLPRLGFVPADGPEGYTGGTLFPMASKKIARAVNAASGNRPVVVLANLTGFDGSPESMRSCQLEYGAEIGRAVVNFRGPIVFCVVSRYHGGAFVVFSSKLNDNMEVAALAGSYASVIGGAPAAAVVFAREVDKRARKDGRLVALQAEVAAADGPAKTLLRVRADELGRRVYAETLGKVAEEYDRVHDIHRALAVGSVHKIIAPVDLRPYLVGAIERGIARG